MSSRVDHFFKRARQSRTSFLKGMKTWGVFALWIGLLQPLPAGHRSVKQEGADANRGRLTYDQTLGVFKVLDLEMKALKAFCGLNSQEMAQKFQVFPLFKTSSDLAAFPMMGRYECHADSIWFRPSFELQQGITYEARFHMGGIHGESDLELSKRFPIKKVTAQSNLAVVDIYPRVEEVPANLLKIYIAFSGSMSQEFARQHVKVLDGAGQVIEGAFLDLEAELWNKERDRLTLLLDPGRIKRGLAPHESHGPPLASGMEMTVVIEPAWPDGQGLPLQQGFQRRYLISAADRVSPNPAHWHWDLPTVGSLEPLGLRFPESLDAALLQSALWITDAMGRPLQGEIELAPGETRWLFRPLVPWREGAYLLQVAEQLEDLAGNNLTGVFDRDLRDPKSSARSLGQSRHLAFHLKP